MRDFFFSYFYYRITQAYFRWDKRNSITAAIGIAMIQSMLPFDLLILVLIKSNGKKTSGPLYPLWVNYSWVVVSILLVVYNHYKYFNKYSQYKMKWKDEPRQQRVLKGALVLFFMILPWAIILLGSHFNWYSPPGTP
jgi:hypothetical protein